jgi:hypothetical protein
MLVLLVKQANARMGKLLQWFAHLWVVNWCSKRAPLFCSENYCAHGCAGLMALIAWIKNPEAVTLVRKVYGECIEYTILTKTRISVFAKQNAKNQIRFFAYIH